MANPNPQHNPTDGLGVAVAIQLTASSGSTVWTALRTPAANKPYPVLYNATMSVSASGGFVATITPTASLVDASNAAYTAVGTFRWRSYNWPLANAPSYFKPSRFSDTLPVINYNDNVASVNNTTGLITALNPGQAIIETAFPTFDNTVGLSSTVGGSIDVNQPVYTNMIYVLTILQVNP